MIDLHRFFQTLKKIQKPDLELGGLLLILSFLIIVLQLLYLNLRFDHLAGSVPLFYTRFWGLSQIASKSSLFLIPSLSVFISAIGLMFFFYLSLRFYKYGPRIVFFIVLFSDLFLSASLFRIVHLSLIVSTSLISPDTFYIAVPFLLALFLVVAFSKIYLLQMHKMKIVTDPEKHSHPAMILSHPSARGGGLLFACVFVLTSLFFVPLTVEVVGVIFGVLCLAIVGIIDDYQNTHSESKLKFLENPVIRLGLLFIVVGILYFFNIRIDFLSNPFNGLFYLNNLNFALMGVVISPVSWILTTVWVVWILNLLSWSNGVDGQYSGMVGIALLIVAFLALRFPSVSSEQYSYAQLAVIAAGVSFGLIVLTWYPSKIMWGFGAMSAGIVLASISILVQAKIITSVLILFVPFLDAVVTFFRRVFRGRNPLRADREHLHHLLLARGFSVPQVAIFYWLVTLLFGGLSIFSVENPTLQTVFLVVGTIFFLIVLVNLRVLKKKPPQQLFE